MESYKTAASQPHFQGVEGKSPGVILNLGCGIKTSRECVNIDWSWWLRIARNPILKAAAPLVLDRAKLKKLEQIASQPIMLHNLRNGIPFRDGTVDAVYHSHVIEHIDRDSVDTFIQEVRRVLKPGGIHRIVAPDLEPLARTYLASIANDQQTNWRKHDQLVADIVEQMVRRESAALRDLKSFRRKLDILVRGDARQRGETHQWMYDRISLSGLLEANGFGKIRILDYQSSGIPGWESIGLDLEAGREYKPGSIYVECVK